MFGAAAAICCLDSAARSRREQEAERRRREADRRKREALELAERARRRNSVLARHRCGRP